MNSMIKSMMKVKELIEILKKYDDEDDVELIAKATDEAEALLVIKDKECIMYVDDWKEIQDEIITNDRWRTI